MIVYNKLVIYQLYITKFIIINYLITCFDKCIKNCNKTTINELIY